MVGANDLGKRLGIENIITADMGGTSLDVSVISHAVNDVEHGLTLYGRWAYGLGVDDSLILF